MKKYLSEDGARLLTRIRQAATQKSKRRNAQQRKRATLRISHGERIRRDQQRRRAITESRHLPPVALIAPENFSLLTNTEEMITFFGSISAALEEGKGPTLDMREVKSLGPDAIAVLNSTLDRVAAKHQVAISGTVPRVPAIADVLRRSGFYDHVQAPRGMNYRGADRGMISHEQEHIVDTPKAHELVQYAIRTLTGQPGNHRASYVALGELMHDTFDHASGDVSGKEPWWASVYIDEEQRIAHFTFLDNGVGILGSRPVKLLDPLRRVLNLTDDAELLLNIFQGKLASRTGIAWRGQGLPRVYKRVKTGHITDMTVITNGVIGNLDRDEFKPLNVPFPGTLYHWEVRAA